VVYISGQVFIPIEINILTMLLTYQKESVHPSSAIHHPLLAIHPPLAIHQPLLAIHLSIHQPLLAFMPSNDY